MRLCSKLIQRREPRNMIRTLFLGRLDHDRLRKAGGIPAPVEQAVTAVSEALQADGNADAVLANAFARAGFRTPASPAAEFDGVIAQAAFWLEAEPVTDGKRALRERLERAFSVANKWRDPLARGEARPRHYPLAPNSRLPPSPLY